MARGRSSLERIAHDAGNQAHFIDHTHACIELRVKTGGFHRFMFAFQDRPDLLTQMADQLIKHPDSGRMTGQLSSVLGAIHVSEPFAFRERALTALESGAIQVIHAAANNFRVYDGATEEDIAIIQAYAGYPDPVAKRGAIFAITYMGKFVELRQSLKEAALSIRTEGNGAVATDLAGACGPYGVPLTALTREDASSVALELLHVPDWDESQGAIPRFLSHFASLFPDETFDLLLRRIELNSEAIWNNQHGLRSFGVLAGFLSQMRLNSWLICFGMLLDTMRLRSISSLRPAANVDVRGVRNISILIDKAIPKLVFTNPGFTKNLLRSFSGERRQQVVEALAHQSHRFVGAGAFAGSPEDYMARKQKQFTDNVAVLPDDPELSDLARAIRRFT